MKKLSEYINESNLTREEVRKDYDSVEYLDTKAEKLEMAKKYGIESAKKDDIYCAILLKLREFRKTAVQFTDDDFSEFMRLSDYSLKRLPEYLSKESSTFVEAFRQYYFDRFMSKRLKSWIGMNPGNSAYGLSYADKDHIKYYNKILEFIANNTPKTRTAKDEIFDMLVNKFTELLEDYKKEYLKKVEEFAKKRFTEILPKDLEDYKSKRKEVRTKLDSIDWRSERSKYNETHKALESLDRKIFEITKLFEKYNEKTYSEVCVKEASEEFESNIKELASRIQKDELEVDKLTIKSIHDDPKVFNMKITDGVKNLYCRSIIAALGSSYMRPHYRFIITNRSKDDSHYFDED